MSKLGKITAKPQLRGKRSPETIARMREAQQLRRSLEREESSLYYQIDNVIDQITS